MRGVLFLGALCEGDLMCKECEGGFVRGKGDLIQSQRLFVLC